MLQSEEKIKGKLKRVVIREEFVKITGDFVKAVILNQLIYWQSRTYNKEGWIYKKAEELSEETMLYATKATIRRHLGALEKLKLVESRDNPTDKWDRTKQYRIRFDVIYDELEKQGFSFENALKPSEYRSLIIKLRSLKNKPRGLIIKLRSLENKLLYNDTEITTENTTKSTHIPASAESTKLVPQDKYFGVCIFLFSKQPYSYSKEEAESEANSLFAALKPDSWLELAKSIDRIIYLSFQPDFSQRPKNPLGLLKKSGIQKGKCAIRVNGTYRESWLPREIEKPKPEPKKENLFDWSKVTEEQIGQTAEKLNQFMKTQYQKHGLDSLAVKAAFEEILEGEI